MKVYLETKDYFNTQESFTLLYDEKLDMLITSPEPSNLEKYYETNSYISHTDQSTSLIDKIYQKVKNHSLKRKLDLINSLNTNNKKLLDIGAGTGDFLKKISNNQWTIKGVEPNSNARTIATKKGLNLSQKLSEIIDTDFDIITLWHVLEHLPNLDEQIKDITRKLDAKGYLIVAVPNYKSYDAKKYKGYWAAYDTPRHLWHFSRKTINALFSKHGLKVIKTKPMHFDSFYVSLLSEKYKHGKNRYLSGFLTGLLSNLRGFFTKEYSSLIYILQKN